MHRRAPPPKKTVLVLALAGAAATGAAAPAPAAQKPAAPADNSDLPAAVPRGTPAESDRMPLPPFGGMFGPVELIRQTGFRGQVGSYIEYRPLQTAGGGAPAGTVRFQQVGPEVRGGRWIEMLAGFGSSGMGGTRFLTRGDGDNNVERVVIMAPGLAPMEVPLESVEASGPMAAARAQVGEATRMGDLRREGRETVVVPLGKFAVEKWVLLAGKDRVEFWVTSDPSVPFIGAVKIRNIDGVLEATRVGKDAQAAIPVPATGR